MEQWKPVLGFEGSYEVSDMGRVRSIDRINQRGYSLKGKELRIATTHFGYLSVALSGGSRAECKRHLVHRLVLNAFIGPQPPGLEGCHNNGIRSDARLVNLRWASRAENYFDSVIHGTAIRGEKHPNAKLTAKKVMAIFDESRYGEPAIKLAVKYGVAPSVVQAILAGKKWRHVVAGERAPVNKARGERVNTAKLTSEKVRQIRLERDGGALLAEIGRAYGVTEQSVWRICRRYSWKHVT